MFNKEVHINNMKKPLEKLVSQLKAKGVSFSHDDPSGLENVVLTFKNKVVKISHHSFYRYTGIACVTKEGKEKNSSEWVEVTDEMWCQIFLKQIIETLLDVKAVVAA